LTGAASRAAIDRHAADRAKGGLYVLEYLGKKPLN
jgi:hypothetical protein